MWTLRRGLGPVRFSLLAALLAASVQSTALAQAEPPSEGASPAAAASAAEPAAGDAAKAPKTFTLDEALLAADKNHPQIQAARARVAKARGLENEALTAPFSIYRMTAGVGVGPELRGTGSYTPDNDVVPERGAAAAWQVNLSGLIPLWTFGKIGSLQDAAEANVQLNEKGVEKERDAVRLQVRQAYYGLLLARDGLLLLEDIKRQIGNAEASLTEKIARDEGDKLDLFKLQTFVTELDVRRAEAEKFATVALTGLRFYTGIADFDVPDAPLTGPTHTLLPVEAYLAASVENRPELGQARYGLLAREALVRGKEAAFYPDVGLGLSLGLGVAPGIDDQSSPFIVDPGNFFRYGAGIVFQWSLDFAPQVARLDQAKADLEEMKAIARFADEGVAAEVRVAYAEVVDWTQRLEAHRKSVQAAKRWLVYVQSGLDVGTIEDKELLEPAKAYAFGRFAVMNATMELDLALAKLAKACGWDTIAPTGLPPRGELQPSP